MVADVGEKETTMKEKIRMDVNTIGIHCHTRRARRGMFSSKSACSILLAFMTCLFAGCIRTLTVPPDLAFEIRSAKSNKEVGLYLSEETTKYVAKGAWGENRYQVSFGQSVATNGCRSLGRIFSKVTLMSKLGSTENVYRIFSIAFTDGTKVKPAKTVFSNNQVDVGLRLFAYDSKGNLLWQRDIGSLSADASAKGKGLVALASPGAGAFVGISAMNSSLGKAAQEAMRLALEQVNDVIVSQEKNAF